jgi:hypothetical protein
MTTAGASFAGGNDSTISVQISIDGPNVTAQRNRIGAAGNYPYQVVEGRIDGDSIRASNKYCTLSLTRDPASAQAASSQFDGTYTGAVNTASGNLVRTVKVIVVGGRGSGTIWGPQGDSSFAFIIAPNGKVTGSGELYQSTGAQNKLRTEIGGEASAAGLSITLGGLTSGAGNRAWLTRGGVATAASTAPSPFDGTYQAAMKTGTGSGSPLTVRTINVKVVNGAGSGTISTPVTEDAGTLTFEISPSGKIVGKGEIQQMKSTDNYRRGPIDVQGEADKDGLALRVGSERVWVPRLKD